MRVWRGLAAVWAVALVLEGVRLLALPVVNDLGERAYARRDPVAAGRWFGRNLRGNPVERWVAPYNRGVARFGDRDWRGASDDFRAALDLAPGPQRCRVVVNLALALEAAGDELRGLGDEVGARQRYAEGQQATKDTACRPDQQQQPEQQSDADQQEQQQQQQAASTADRLERKQQQPENRPQPVPAPGDEQQRQLDQRQQEAQSRAAQGRDSQDAGARQPNRPRW